MVCCNMDMTDAPELKRYIKPSVVIESGGRKIGIIGYVTTDTPVIHLNIHVHYTCFNFNVFFVENCQPRSNQVQGRNS